MRLIGELENPKVGARFAAYLLTAGIAAKAEETEDGKCEIWVHEEDQFQTAKSELSDFLADPDDSKYVTAVSQATKISRAEDRKRRRIQKKIVVGTSRIRPKPRLTIGLIVICAIVALLTDFGSQWQSGLFRSLEFVAVEPAAASQILAENNGDVDQLGVRLASLKRGEIWRVVTPMLIHHHPAHLLFNMLWLFQLGSLIERRYRWPTLAVLVLLTAAIPNFVQCTVPMRFDGTPPVTMPDGSLLSMLGGMSGVVYGLLGYVWMKSIYDRNSGFMLPPSTVMLMLGWLVFCMVPGLTQNLLGFSVANWAHLIGLLVGMAMGFAPSVRR